MEKEDVYHINDGNETPPDPFYLVYFIMLIQGAGTLFPWNAFISAPDYFNTLYGESTLLYFSTAFSIANLLGLLFVVHFGAKIPLVLRVVPSYVICFIVLLAIPVLGFCHVYGVIGFTLTIIMVIMTALCTALCQGGIFGFAGMLPPIYIQAVMSGNGLAGITTSIIRVITKVTLESKKPVTLETLNLSAAIYFFVSAAVIIVCIVSYFIMVRTGFAAHFLGTGALSEEEKANLLSEEEDIFIDDKASPPPASTLQVLKKIWHMCFLVCFIFFVSLAIFPGISVTIESYYGPKSAMADWLPVLMIVVFNVFDFIGRTLPRFVVVFGEKSVGIPIVLRVVLLPLFIFCIYPRLIVYDAIPLIFMAILALSNGYLSSITMMIAPGLVEPHEREAAGTIMTFFLLLGICLGSNCGLLIGKIVGLN